MVGSRTGFYNWPKRLCKCCNELKVIHGNDLCNSCYDKDYRKKNADKGRCLRCTEPVLPGHIRCKKHLEYDRLHNLELYQDRSIKRGTGQSIKFLSEILRSVIQ